jgi:hypothetical protein
MAANASEREPSDEEFLSDFTSLIPHPTDPRAQVIFGRESLPYKDAVTREKDQYIAAKRRAITQTRERREAAARAAAQRQQEQAEFEAASVGGQHRLNLRQALTDYEQGANVAREAQDALADAHTELDRLKRENGSVDTVKRAKNLGSHRDLIDALEIKLARATETFTSLADALRQALGQAQREFSYLQMRQRQELLAAACAQIEALFDRTALSRSPFRVHQPESLADYAQSVVAWDKACGYFGGRYNWPAVSSPESLLGAVTQLLDRFDSSGLGESCDKI